LKRSEDRCAAFIEGGPGNSPGLMTFGGLSTLHVELDGLLQGTQFVWAMR